MRGAGRLSRWRRGDAGAHGIARSSCARQRQQHVLARRRPDQLHAGGQPVLPLVERQRDRRLAGHVDDRRVRREGARAPVVAPRVGPAAVDLAGRAAAACPAPASAPRRSAPARPPGRGRPLEPPWAVRSVSVSWSRACSHIAQVSGSTSSSVGSRPASRPPDERRHRDQRPERAGEVGQQPQPRPRRPYLLDVVARATPAAPRRHARPPRRRGSSVGAVQRRVQRQPDPQRRAGIARGISRA